MAERMEPRVLYSADALGPLAPLLLDDADEADRAERDVAALLGGGVEPVAPSALGTVGAGHLVVVDAAVADAEAIVEGLRERGASAVLVGDDEDGLLVVSRALAAEDGLDAVHLVAHGRDGALTLGTATLDAAALEANGTGIARWGEALAPDGDLLLYGCDVAAGEDGVALVGALAELTGTDVAASDDRTGHASLGGDWTLEVAHGAIEAAALDDAALGGDWRHALGTFTVTETADGINAPPGIATLADLAAWEAADPGNRATLRDALLVAARSGEADVIALGAGTYDLGLGSGGDDDGLEGDLDIAGTVTIVGQGQGATTLRMDGSDRVIEVLANADLTLTGVTVTGGYIHDNGDDGAGILVGADARLTLEDVAVTGNDAKDKGGAIHAENFATLALTDVELRDNVAGDAGGALFVEQQSVSTLTRVTIASNSAGLDGGGIYAADLSTIDVVDSRVEDNTADGRGGGIRADALTLAGSVISGNTAVSGSGGGLMAEGTFTARDVLFENNGTGRHGGGAHLHGASTLERVTFAGNTATEEGGGLSVHTAEATTVSGATFSGNVGDRGGGLHADGDVRVERSTFYDNLDWNRGGAIWVDGSHVVEVGNSVFEDNRSQTGARSVSTGVDSLGFNVVSDDSEFAAAPSDRQNLDAGLEPLAPDGPVLLTHRPGDGSPLIDAGGGAGIADAGGRTPNEIPDIGAHERADASDVIYYVDDNSRILRAGAGLEHPQVIIDDAANLVDVAVDLENGRLYWLEDNGLKLGESALDGSDRSPLLSTAPSGGATAVAVDPSGGHLLVAFRVPLEIRRFELGGVGPPGEVVVDAPGALGGIVDIAVAGGGATGEPARVYWADQGAPGVDKAIRSALIEGTNADVRTEVNSGLIDAPLFEAFAVSADAKHLYWSDPTRDFVVHYDIDARLVSSVYSDPGSAPRAIAVTADGDRVFWSNDAAADPLYPGGALLAADTNFDAREDALVEHDVQAIDVGRTSDVGDPPVPTAPAILGVDEGGARALQESGLAAADDLSADDALTWTVVTPPSNGTIERGGSVVTTFTEEELALGLISYRHDGGESIADLLTLQVDDGTSASAPLTMTIVVTPVNDAPRVLGGSGTLSVDEGAAITLGTGAIDVADDDTDAADLRYTASAMSHGRLLVDGAPATSFTDAELRAGEVVYEHDGGESTEDTLELALDDGAGGTLSRTIAIDVTPVNDPPSLAVGAATVLDGVPLVLTADHLAALDAESGADELVYTIASRPAHGTLTVDGDAGDDDFTQRELDDGKVVYTHPFEGDPAHRLELGVTLADGDGGEVGGTLPLDVAPHNADAPIGADDAIAVSEGGTASALVGGATSVLDNDSDPQGPADPLTASLVDAPLAGDVTLETDGRFVYTHDGGESLSDRFTYVVRDGAGQPSAPVTVAIDVAPINDPPLLVGSVGVQSATEGMAFELPLLGSLWADPDTGDTLTLEATLADGSALPDWLVLSGDAAPAAPGAPAAPVDPGAPGAGSPATGVAPPATLAGTPGNDDVGSLEIHVVARDAAGSASPTLVVRIDVADVNAPPGPIALDVASVDENRSGAVIGRLSVSDEDVGDNVTLDVDDPRFVVVGDELRLEPGSALDHESEPLVPIVVTATDTAGAMSSASFDITVRDVADGPVARDDTLAVEEGGRTDALTGGAASLLDNDGTGAGDARVELVDGPRFGALAIAPDGTFSYVHDGSENHVDTFRYTVRDASGQVADAATVTIVVEPVNDPPVPRDAALAAAAIEGQPFNLVVVADGWTDPDAGDTLALDVTRADGSPLPAWLGFDAASGLLSGTPANADVGRLALVIEARDAAGAAAPPLALTLDVANVNTAPSRVTLAGTDVAENAPGATVGRLAAVDEDVGDTVRYAVADPRFAIDGDSLRLAATNALDFETEPFVETVVTATDAAGASRDEAVRITVLDRNDAPTARAVDDPGTLSPGEVYTVPADLFGDADGDPLDYRATGADGGALPDWLRFDADALAFTVVAPAANEDGEVESAGAEATAVRLHADDGRGGSAFVELAFRRPPALGAAEPDPPVEPVPEPTPEPGPPGPAPDPIPEPAPEPPVEPTPGPIPEPEPPMEPMPEPEPEPEPQPQPQPQPAATAEPEPLPTTPSTSAPARQAAVETEATVAEATAPATLARAAVDVVPADRARIEIETVNFSDLFGGTVESEDEEVSRATSVHVAPEPSVGDALLRPLAIDTIDLASLLQLSGTALTPAFDGLERALERERDAIDERETFARTLVGSSVGVTSGLSVGYLIWLIRGGTLMGSVLSSLPAWRFVDPLPILDALADDVDGDDESLESLVDGDGTNAPDGAASVDRPPGGDTDARPSTGRHA